MISYARTRLLQGGRRKRVVGNHDGSRMGGGSRFLSFRDRRERRGWLARCAMNWGFEGYTFKCSPVEEGEEVQKKILWLVGSKTSKPQEDIRERKGG